MVLSTPASSKFSTQGEETSLSIWSKLSKTGFLPMWRCNIDVLTDTESHLTDT